MKILTTEDLNHFKQELFKELENIYGKSKSIQDRKYLRSSEVIELLNISNSTLQNLRNNGLPYSKLSGTLYYKYSDIIDLLEKNAKK